MLYAIMFFLATSQEVLRIYVEVFVRRPLLLGGAYCKSGLTGLRLWGEVWRWGGGSVLRVTPCHLVNTIRMTISSPLLTHQGKAKWRTFGFLSGLCVKDIE